ncbi:CHRD domain-containing protein [Ottowia sp. GY511]|uniref:CHRD domain-containing protein n=1 Tax=Ottowia flava TaxID=2675430 RepID=A0ABW4KP66_9BURK|nr:CHRD domain-containing protein [Ottowia sp. GY511]TXK26461.1 CHRD domain-containing protein [Ottowia sp. GY511]
MSTFTFPSSRSTLVLLALAVLVGGCASVDLGPRYNPPPVRMPQTTPPAQAPMPPVAQPSAVPPVQPMPQALPPIGTPPVGVPGAVPPAPIDPQASVVTLSTRLDAANTLPPARSSGTGQLDAIYDANTRLFRWKASWSGLSGAITGAQFHGPADQGQNGPATLVWPGPFGPKYEGRATLTPEQAVDLMGGRWYLNVQTTANPGGELRGQLHVVH